MVVSHELSFKCVTQYNSLKCRKYCGFHDVKKNFIQATFDYFIEKYKILTIRTLII